MILSKLISWFSHVLGFGSITMEYRFSFFLMICESCFARWSFPHLGGPKIPIAEFLFLVLISIFVLLVCLGWCFEFCCVRTLGVFYLPVFLSIHGMFCCWGVANHSFSLIHFFGVGYSCDFRRNM